MPIKNAPFKRLIYIYVMIKKRGRNGGNALRVAVFFLRKIVCYLAPISTS